MTTDPGPEGRWMKVDFYGLLPAGAGLFPRDYLDATGHLAELFGFSGIAHLTVREEISAAPEIAARETTETGEAK